MVCIATYNERFRVHSPIPLAKQAMINIEIGQPIGDKLFQPSIPK